MGKKYNMFKLSSACIILTLVGVYAGYARMTRIQSFEEVDYYYNVEAETANLEIKNIEDEVDDNGARISSDTSIIYEHYDPRSGETQILQASPPNFMINKTQDEVRNSFTQWDILSFGDDEVVMRRTINNAPRPEYTLGVNGEFIAVFYGDEVGENIKEITNIPVSALPIEEQERLKRGIAIYDQDELIRRLEDYSS